MMTLEAIPGAQDQFEVEEAFMHDWPHSDTAEMEMYEELKRRQPHAANVKIGVALMKARWHARNSLGKREIIDKAESWLVEPALF